LQKPTLKPISAEKLDTDLHGYSRYIHTESIALDITLDITPHPPAQRLADDFAGALVDGREQNQVVSRALSGVEDASRSFLESNAEALTAALRQGLSTWDERYHLIIFGLAMTPPGADYRDWYEFVPWSSPDKRPAPLVRWQWAGSVANRFVRGVRMSPALDTFVVRLDQYAQLSREQFSTLALSDLVYSARRASGTLRRIAIATLAILAALTVVFALDAADIVEVTGRLSELFREIAD
jgi:hypothetical protein